MVLWLVHIFSGLLNRRGEGVWEDGGNEENEEEESYPISEEGMRRRGRRGRGRRSEEERRRGGEELQPSRSLQETTQPLTYLGGRYIVV